MVGLTGQCVCGGSLKALPLLNHQQQFFVLMMYEEDNIPYQSQIQGSDTFLNALLNQRVEHKEGCREEEERLGKEMGAIAGSDHDQGNNCQFPMGLLEKEELNCFLPEKPFQEQGEEDMILLRSLNRRPEDAQDHAKRGDRINKIAYQEQTRAMKIDRYMNKKARRKWDRKIFYDCRKFVADHRERVNGRFVKKSPFVNPLESTHKNSLATGDLEIPKEFLESAKKYEVEELFLS